VTDDEFVPSSQIQVRSGHLLEQILKTEPRLFSATLDNFSMTCLLISLDIQVQFVKSK